MEEKKNKNTLEWHLLKKGRNYLSSKNLYSRTNMAYRFFNGDQWDGLKKGLVEPITLNFLKPIVKYKIGVVNGNGYEITFNPNNYDDPNFQFEMTKICDALNEYVAIVWERQKLDQMTRNAAKDSCICGEGIVYINYDLETNEVIPEAVDNTDIYYENENDENIQDNNYIIITNRESVKALRLKAKKLRKEGYNKLTDEDIETIVGDEKTEYRAGDYASDEVNDMVTVISYFKKKDGYIWLTRATESCVIEEERNLGIKQFPIAHFVWESVKGSARGIGEINSATIANQIEVNKTATRESASITMTAYPKMVVDREKIANPSSINKVGSVIYTKGKQVEDVRNVVGYINSMPLSQDAVNFKNELMSHTQDLAGAGDQLTGNVNPERASGQAILAVQQQAEQTMTEQLIRYKNFLEDISRIIFEMWKVYTDDEGKKIIIKKDVDSIQNEQPPIPEGISSDNPYAERPLEEVEEQRQAGIDERALNNVENSSDSMDNNLIDLQKETEVEKRQVYVSEIIPREIIDKLEVSIKIDITPATPFDKYAYQQSIDNMLQQGIIDFEEWVTGLRPDSVIPRQPFIELLQRRKDKEARINELDQQAEMKKAEMEQQMQEAEQAEQPQQPQQEGQMFYQDVAEDNNNKVESIPRL